MINNGIPQNKNKYFQQELPIEAFINTKGNKNSGKSKQVISLQWHTKKIEFSAHSAENIVVWKPYYFATWNFSEMPTKSTNATVITENQVNCKTKYSFSHVSARSYIQLL